MYRLVDWTVYRNGSLWTAQTIFLPATGTPNRCSVQWWQIDTTAGDLGGLQQLGRIDDPTAKAFFAYPSIGVTVKTTHWSDIRSFGDAIRGRKHLDANGRRRPRHPTGGSRAEGGRGPLLQGLWHRGQSMGRFQQHGRRSARRLSLWTSRNTPPPTIIGAPGGARYR